MRLMRALVSIGVVFYRVINQYCSVLVSQEILEMGFVLESCRGNGSSVSTGFRERSLLFGLFYRRRPGYLAMVVYRAHLTPISFGTYFVDATIQTQRRVIRVTNAGIADMMFKLSPDKRVFVVLSNTCPPMRFLPCIYRLVEFLNTHNRYANCI